MTKSLWFRLPVIILTTTGLLFVLFQRGYVRIQYPSRADFPVRGVDVSHHQDDIDWSKDFVEAVTTARLRIL